MLDYLWLENADHPQNRTLSQRMILHHLSKMRAIEIRLSTGPNRCYKVGILIKMGYHDRVSKQDNGWNIDKYRAQTSQLVLDSASALLEDGPLKSTLFVAAETELTRMKLVSSGFPKVFRSLYLRMNFDVELASAIHSFGFYPRYNASDGHQAPWFQNRDSLQRFAVALGYKEDGAIRTAGRGPQFEHLLGKDSIMQPKLFGPRPEIEPAIAMLVLDTTSTVEDPRMWVAGIVCINKTDSKLLEYSFCEKLHRESQPPLAIPSKDLSRL